MRTRSGGVVLSFALVAALVAFTPAPAQHAMAEPPEAEVAALSGTGWGDAFLCVGCIGALVFGGGGAPLGIIAFAALNAEFTAACAFVCVGAAW